MSSNPYNKSTSQAQVLGTMGECLVAKTFGFVPSSNRFDSEKDMTDRAGRTIEVKTQKRYSGMLTIHSSQYKKCTEADVTVFVEYDETDTIRLWQLPHNPVPKHTSYTTRAGKQMYGWHVKDLYEMDVILNPVLAELMRHYSNDVSFRDYTFCQPNR